MRNNHMASTTFEMYKITAWQQWQICETNVKICTKYKI